MPNDASIDVPETEVVSATRVSCDGSEGALGHPRVYLTVDPVKGYVECPYCDKRFELASDAASH